MTKETRPSHRVEILAHALVYYGMQTKNKVGLQFCFTVQYIHFFFFFVHLLVARWKRAQQIHVTAEESFQNLARSHKGVKHDRHVKHYTMLLVN